MELLYDACRPWLEAALALVEPEVIVTLGASASQAILGSEVRVSRDHGDVFEWEGHRVIPTLHPSAALRTPESEPPPHPRPTDRRPAHALEIAGDG